MLGHRLRRWSSIKPTLGKLIVVAGLGYTTVQETFQICVFNHTVRGSTLENLMSGDSDV